jgi:hypothetical protein
VYLVLSLKLGATRYFENSCFSGLKVMPASDHFVLRTFLEPDRRGIPGRASIYPYPHERLLSRNKKYIYILEQQLLLSIAVHRAPAGDGNGAAEEGNGFHSRRRMATSRAIV